MKRLLQSVIAYLGLLLISVAGYSTPLKPAATITPTGALSALSTTYGTASAETTFSFTAAGLGAAEVVTITAPTGFEVSLTTATGFAPSVTKTADAGGAIAATSIYVRLAAASGVAGSPYSGNITLVGASASANEATVASMVNPKALTETGLSVAASKVYDATTAATVTGTATLQTSEAIGTGTSSDGIPYTGDVVSITGTPTGTYNSKDVATAASVTFGGISLTGAQAGNYSLTIQTAASATITTKALIETGLSVAASKIYNATTAATVTGTASLQTSEAAGAGTTSDGIPYTGDVVSITGTPTGTYNSKDVATAASVTFGGISLTGAQAGNYSLTIQAAASATITTKALTGTGLSVASSKVYDATTTATVTGTAALQTSEAAGAGTTSDGIPYTGDAVSITGTPTGTYNSKDVATAASVTFGGTTLTGAQVGNYSLTIQADASATITTKALTETGLSVAASKIYDATTTATVTGTAALQTSEAAGAGTTSDGIPYTGDAVSITGTATGTYNSKNVATAASVTFGGISLTGAQAGNYSLTIQTAASATITKKALTETGLSVAASKVYDATIAATVTGTAALQTSEAAGAGSTSDGIPYTGDAVSITGTPTGTYNSKDVATAASVTFGGISLTGAQAGNYSLTIQTAASATVTAKALTINGLSVTTKVFDGTTSATLAGTAALLSTETAGTGTTSDGKPYGGDGVTITGVPTATFASAATSAGATGIAVTVTGYTLGGAQAGNYTPTQPTGLTGTINASQPITQATGVSFSATTAASTTVSWTNGNGSSRLVLVNEGATVSASPLDFNVYTASADWSAHASQIGAGNYVVYIGTGSSVVLTNLNPNTTYNVQVFEFNGAAGSGLENFNPSADTNNPKGKTTNNLDNTATLTAGIGSATIASTVNTQGAEVAVFQFVATDLASGDGTSTRFTQLVFKPGAGNQVANWTQLIAGAELSDNAGHGPTQHGTAVIGTTSITIPSISAAGTGSTPSDLGTIADGVTRTYTLKIWLKSSLGGTLPTTVDNLHVEFSLAATDITIVSGRGAFAPTATTSSGATNDKITVTASQLVFTQQPASATNAAVALSPEPIVKAMDANSNLDLDNIAATVSTPDASLSPASAPSQFMNGFMDFTGSGFNYGSTGTSRLTVTTATPSLSVTSTVSTVVTASTVLGASATTMSSSPLFNNTTGVITGGTATNAVLGFKLQTSGSPLTISQFIFTSTPVPTGLVSNFKLYSNTSDTFTGATQVATSASLTFSSLSLPISGTATYYFLVCDVAPSFSTASPTIQFSLPAGNFTVSSGSKAGSTQTGITYTLDDITPPTVQSIAISSSTNAWSTTNGTSASSVNFLVTFSESVTGVNSTDFNIFSDGSVSSFIPSVSGSGSTYTISVPILSGQGHIRIELTDDNSIKDSNSNSLGGSFTGDGNFATSFSGNEYYTIVLPQPNAASGFSISSINQEIFVTYLITHNLSGQSPTNYLVMARESQGATPFPVFGTPGVFGDGVLLVNDPNDGSYAQFMGDGLFIINTAKSGALTQSGFVDGLKSGVSYDFILYPYTQSINYSDDNVDYGPPTTISSVFIPTGTNSSLSPNVTSGTISSTVDTAPEAQSVFQFSVQDGTGSTGYESAPTRFSAVTIRENGILDNVANWSSVIAGAELYDVASPSNFIAALPANIGTNQIVFTNIPSATTGDLGYITRSSANYNPFTINSKTYGLRIYLKNSSGALTGFDDNVLSFSVSTADFTYAVPAGTIADHQASTTFTPNTVVSGSNTINIVATKLVFTTDLPDKIGVKHLFTVAPVIEAFDANNNRDIDFTGATISLDNGAMTKTSTDVFSAGILTLSSFIFNDPGLTHVIVSKVGITSATSSSPTGPSGNTQVVISGFTTVNTTGTPSPTIKSNITFAPSMAPSAGQLNASLLADYSFIVKDDDAVPAAEDDKLPTRINSITIKQNSNNGTAVGGAIFDNWQNSIAGAELSVSGVSVGVTPTINSNSIVFTGLLNSSITDLGYVTDDGSRTYTLKIWLKNPIDPTLQDIFDGEDFVFEITNASDFVLSSVATSYSSTLNTITPFNSGDGNNVVDVTATRLDFTTQWLTNAIQNYDTPLDADAITSGTQSPIAKARDVNGNLDRGYNTVATVNTATPATYPLINNTVTVTNGLITFNAGLKVSSMNGGLNNATTNLILSSGVLTNGISNSFKLNYSGNSDVIIDAGFTHPTNVPYATSNNQAADITSGTGVALEQFTFRDGGGSPDVDGTDTKLFAITLNIDNYQFLRRVALYDGSTEIADLDVSGSNITINSATNADIMFTGISTFTVTDDMIKNLTVKVSFLSANIIDNSIIKIKVKSVAATPVSSSFTPGASTIFPTLGTNEDQIEVTATELDFTTPSSNTSASLNSNFIVVTKARDANANLDLDFNGTISGITNATNATMQDNGVNINTTGSSIIFGTTAFSGGVYSFPTSFQFTSGNNNDDVTLSIAAGGINNVPVSPGPAPFTPIITLSSSFESVLLIDPAFTSPPLNISYELYQDITTASTSVALAQFKLNDGNGSSNDLDGAATNIKDITFSLTNATNVRSLGIYVGTSLVQPVDFTSFVQVGTTTTYTIPFTALSGSVSAPDNGSLIFTVRASFFNTAAKIHDNDGLQLKIESVTQNGGSKFNIIGSAPLIGGVTGGAVPALRQLEVTATRLDFTIQPAAIEGINQPITEPRVEARDINGIVDLDHNFSAAISSTVALSSSSLTFVNGILDFTGFQYRAAGDGTLTVTSNGLSSNTGGSNPCTHVDVINVYTTLATGGVVSSPNLAGGAVNKVIFGATFNAPYQIGTDPYLNKFVISFSNSITGVLKNFRVFESTDNVFGSDIDITNPTIGGKITTTSNSLTVDFTQPGGIKRDLTTSSPTGKQLSYFLMVDVDPTANNATPSIQPSITDLGYSNPSTNSNIITSAGSTYSFNTSNTVGPTTTAGPYTFAAIFPPTLTSSNPASGQLNVDPNKPTLDLVFSVPVWTLDGVVSLYDKSTNALVQTLTAVNGQYAGGTTANLAGTAIKPLKFTLPPLAADHVYYITIAPAKFTNSTATTNVGIMDENANLFPGISYSGTLYFKTANPNPPLLLSTAPAPVPSVTNITTTSAVINATFDQQGTAYFMVLSQGSSAPTNAQIKGTATYPAGPQVGTKITNGNFQINQTITISQFGLISPSTPMALNTTYNVWMYAENNSLPTPVPTASPYGGSVSNYAIGGAGPTMSFTTPSSVSTSVTVNAPVISVCDASFQILNSPIIISEGNTSNFTSSGVQTFNLLLPSGFQFDISTTGSVPTYGNLVLLGADFVPGSGSLKFINNSILQVSYTNDGRGGVALNPLNSSSDNIVIYGLRIQAPSTASGNIVRLGGNALSTGAPSQILPDLTPVANLNATDGTPIDFINSYSKNTYGTSAATVTFIPDNYDDPNIATSLLVQLDPLPSSGDYGPSSFSGNGVNINQLSLSAVTLNNPFNITITHTDNNGCISNNPIQYTVYDHTKAIGGLLTDYGIVNTNFPAPATTGVDEKSIVYNNISANYMLSMTADIPTTATPVSSSALPTDQIMFGTAWQSLIQTLPVRIGTATTPVNNSPHDPGNNPVFGQLYYDYEFDAATILNANTLSGGAIPDPYSNFKKVTPVQGNIYYSGGSLGFVEFTANYQSIANSVLQFPLKQNVQFFLPAIPIVELGQANQSFLDIHDATNPVGQGSASNKGTPVFCVQGGKINISGYPAAALGTSVGSFSLVDAQTLVPVTLVTNGFVDNGNGTATLDPSLITNNNKDIKIIYTYQQNSAPSNTQSTGYQIIRIAPNPVAKFNVKSVIGANTPVSAAFCENRAITFDATPSTVSSGSISTFAWNFGDATNSTGQNPNLDSAMSVSHKFIQAAAYSVGLITISDVGCKSDPTATTSNATVKVGSIPTVSFLFNGVSVKDGITFTNASVIPSSQIAGLGDGFKQLDWSFGDATAGASITGSFTSPITHAYVNPGLDHVNLKVTSLVGCVNTLTKDIIILPNEKPTSTASYLENFETANGKWQTSSLPITSSVKNPSSWMIGVPTTSVIKIDPSINDAKVVKTGLTTSYNASEKSAFYSPSFDLSSLSRPMISFNSFTQMETSDGVVLQYSIDSKNVADSTKEWIVLGKPGEGVAWFTDIGIAAKPGNQLGQDYGWSQSNVTQWIESKHVLDPVAGAARVVFRFALASVKQPAFDGFAFDNFRIGERTRTILLENFTTTNGKDATQNATVKSENQFLSTFQATGLGTTVVKMNYHIGFTGTDPFNQDDPADPSARALFYNVKDVPWAFLDGARPAGATTLSTWGQSAYDAQTLQLGQSDITVPTPTIGADGSIKFDVQVRALYDLPDNTVLHVAVIEQSILYSGLSAAQQAFVKTGETSPTSTFDFVVKKMLPSALGTRFGAVLTKNQSRTFTGFAYYPDPTKLYKNPANLADLSIIVFLQNEDTKGIYQTEYITGFPDPPIVTAIEDIPVVLDDVELYPNPADNEFTVQLPVASKVETHVRLADQVGKIVYDSFIPAGSTEKKVYTQDLAAGIYILQLDSGKGAVARKKVLVTHNK